MTINWKFNILSLGLCLCLLTLLLAIKNIYSIKQDNNITILSLVNNQKKLSDKIALLLHVFHTNRANRSAATKSIIRLENTMGKYDKTNSTLMKYINGIPNAIPVDNNQFVYTSDSPEFAKGEAARKLWFNLKKDINKVIEGGNGTITLLENIIKKNEQIRWELNNIIDIYQSKYEKDGSFIQLLQFFIMAIGFIILIPIIFIISKIVRKKDNEKRKTKNNYLKTIPKRNNIKSQHKINTKLSKDFLEPMERKNNLQNSILENSNSIKNNNSSDEPSINNMLKAISKLKQSSNQVELIRKIVDEMVLQLNLISINTAVELENMGASKSGLIIIANEIRDLSEQSVDNAKTVLDIINDNLKDTESVYNIAESIAEYNEQK